ncbi:MAG: glutamyl-tRNA reductase [Planctomycetota bacterium]|jgi:glutamyl-tRNA reductase
MNRLGVIGLSWRHASPADLAVFGLPEGDRAAWMRELAAVEGLQEVLFLNTCSRVEIYFRMEEEAAYGDLRRRVFECLSGRLPNPGEAERTLRAWNGEGAAEHMLMVVTGLESAQVGETEVLGQFRKALALSQDLGLAGGTLGLIAEESLKVARRVRQRTGLDEGKTSLAEIALRLVRDRYKQEQAPVALVGVSPMTERCAEGLAADDIPIVWVNRTLTKAALALKESGARGRVMDLDLFVEQCPVLSSVVLATGSTGSVLKGDALQRLVLQNSSGGNMLPVLVDLAVPPDVDPAEASFVGLQRVGMDEILIMAQDSSRAKEERAIEARVAIDDALDKLRDICGVGAIGRMARAVQAHYSEKAAQSFAHLCKRDLRGISTAHQDRLILWTQQLAKQMAHLPTSGLRQVIRDQGQEALDSFLAHAHPDLVRNIREALEEETFLQGTPDSRTGGDPA